MQGLGDCGGVKFRKPSLILFWMCNKVCVNAIFIYETFSFSGDANFIDVAFVSWALCFINELF